MFRTSLRRGSRRGWRRGCNRARPLSVAVPVLAFVFALSSPVFVSAAAFPWPPAGELALDLDQAVQRAREASALVRRARAESQVTAARRVEAAIALPANPALAFAVGPSRDATPGAPERHGLGYRLHVEQAIELAGQRGTRLREVDRAVDAATARERLAGIEAGARARSAYVRALLATALAEATADRETLARQLEDSVRARVEAGAASEIELRLAEVERGRMHRERVDAERLAGEATAELLALLALPPETSLRLTTPLAAPRGGAAAARSRDRAGARAARRPGGPARERRRDRRADRAPAPRGAAVARAVLRGRARFARADLRGRRPGHRAADVAPQPGRRWPARAPIARAPTTNARCSRVRSRSRSTARCATCARATSRRASRRRRSCPPRSARATC